MNLGADYVPRSHCSLLVRAAGQRSARLSYLSSVAFVVMSAVDIAAKAVFFTASSTSATHGITVGQIIVRKMKVLDDAPPASVAQRGI